MKKQGYIFKALIFASVLALAGCGNSNTQSGSAAEDAVAPTVSTEETVQTESAENADDKEDVTEAVAEASSEPSTEPVVDSDDEEEEEVEEVEEVGETTPAPSADTASEPATVETPETAISPEPSATVPTENTDVVVVTDIEDDPTAPTGDIPATVTWTYTAMVADNPDDFSIRYETFTVTTRNPGLHSVEYYQAHPWKLYNENNTDELGNISFLGWPSYIQCDPWGELYHEGKAMYLITDDSYLCNFTIRTPNDYYAVQQYQIDNNNSPDVG